jgi:hypothetical protein
MSTIQEVRSAETVRWLLNAMKRHPTGAHQYIDEFKNATDEYARAIRELKSKAVAKG